MKSLNKACRTTSLRSVPTRCRSLKKMPPVVFDIVCIVCILRA